MVVRRRLALLAQGKIREQLKRVTSNEQVQVDDGALTLVARSAEGSMRDALSALDQVLAFTTDRGGTIRPRSLRTQGRTSLRRRSN